MSIASPVTRHLARLRLSSYLFRSSFPCSASTSRLPARRLTSHLAQPSSEPSGFEGVPAAVYVEPVEGKGKSKALDPTSSAPRPRSIKSMKSAISMVRLSRASSPPPSRLPRTDISQTPAALDRLRSLVSSPTEPKLLRIGVKSRGCAGMAYHLDYVPPPGGRFDEVVEQDGVRVLIDSKALFSIIGSRMDWRDNRLSAGFVFDK